VREEEEIRKRSRQSDYIPRARGQSLQRRNAQGEKPIPVSEKKGSERISLRQERNIWRGHWGDFQLLEFSAKTFATSSGGL